MKRISQLLVVLAALLFPLGMHATDFDLSGYSLVKSMDFSGFEAETALTQGETATEKAWDNGNGQNQTMYHVTDEAYAGYLIVQAFANKGFIIGANSGLYSKSAQRCAAVVGRTKGQVVVFTTTQDADKVMSFYKTHAKGNNLPDGNYNLTKATDGNGYYVVMTDDGYLGFNGLNNKQAIAKIDIYQPNEGTNLANYAVKYVDENGAELQEAKTYTSAIGMQCNVYPADRPATITVGETTYVLSSNDAAEQTVAADGSTVVTLTYKVAVPVPYSVVEKAGDNIFRTTTGEAVTGSVIKLPYRFYNAANGQLYKKAQTSKEFNYSFTLTEENQVENLEYSAVEGVNNVVFITEGEDVPGLTPCNSSNTGIRSSNSASAYASEDTKIVTLGPGTYKIHAIIYDASKNPDSHWIFKAGEQQIADLNCTTVNIQELDSEEFTLTETTDIIMAAAGGNTMGLDALYIVGDGKAYDNLPAVLTFPDYNDQEISAYDKEWTATVDGAVWTLNGFNNNKNAWNYVRCGRKAKAQTATILSPALYANVTNVVYTVDKTSNVTKATVTVLNGEETVNTIDITEKFAAGNVNVEVEGQPGYSYLLTIDSDDQATGNGPTQISKVALYAEGQYVEVHIANTEDDPYTVEKAIELIEAGEALNEIVFVKGIITQVDEVNAEYGNATYWIADSEGAEQQLQVYRGLNIGGEKFTSEEQLEVGATVVVKGQLLKYGSKYELNQGNELVSYSAPVDVTSEYLKNADFAASTPVEAEAIFGYGKDGSPYGLQDVEEWTKVVVREDPNSAADYPGSGMGGGVMAYGSPTILKGNNVAAPAVGPNGEAGNALGFFGVWACGGYYAQNVTLPAGAYTMSVPMYSQSGTAETTSYTGFFADGSDKGYTVATNPEPGAWATQTVKFVLTKETAGQIRLGYVSNGSGSGANPMLFIDGVKLVKADIEPIDIAKADLQAEIAAAEALLATGEKGKTELEEAIAAAKNVLATATTAEEMEAALNALKKAELDFKIANAPVPSGTYYVMNASEEGDWFMAAGHNWGTRAIINNEGLDLIINYDAPTGKYTIDSRVSNGGNNHYLGSNLYMDAAAFGWTIASDNGFTFTISNGTQYIGIDSDYNLAMTDQPAEWAFVDAAYLQNLRMEEGLEAMKAATADNGVDATFLLKDAQFNRNDQRQEAWTVSENCTNKNLGGGCDGNSGNGCAESYHSPFTISQIAKGAPAGVYTLTAQGFYRQDDGVEEPAPYFFIGDAKGDVPVRTGEENSMTQAGASFEQGLYTIEPIQFTVTEGGELIVGVTNGENAHQWVIWDNFRLTYYGAASADVLEQNITHERYPGLGYGATECTVDFTEAKAWLGVEQITTDMLRIENPDGELISDYAPFDGWFDGEGVATTWGENTKINVKFFQAIPDGVFTICDMNGADELGKTYTVKWRLVNGEKSVRYTINVKFVEKPVLDLTFADLNQKGNDVVVPFTSELGKCYEGFSGDVDVAAILSTLEAASLSDVDIYAVQSDGSLDDNYKLGTTDGWRNAAGDWQGWGADARFYVKADFAREAGQLYEVGGMEGTTNEPASYTATYAFVKKGTKDAVVLKVTLTYPDPDELIANGNCEGADGGCLLSKNGDGDGSFIWNVQDGVGVDGSKAAVVHATGTAANEWDAQFFIFAKDHVFTIGEKYKVTMWLKADKAASNSAQAHTTPGTYKHWRIISDGSSIPFTTEWTELVYEGVIDENMEGVQTIAFNLNTDKTLENNYYFDNISWKLIKEEDGIETVQTVQTEVNGIYNLRGQKVDKPVKGGIYIINGKKVVIK
ncbi:MAG: DUF4859 domain-containing protein [Prevotella sp.]|nr:DUF4859 domain-containing protein [Prevotella sp.]